MKKILSIICLFLGTLLLVACGSNSNTGSGTTKKNNGGKKKESATFDSITLNEKGLLEWNKITGASYYYIHSGYSKDNEKYIDGTSTQLRLYYEYDDPEVDSKYYNYYTVTVSACTTRSEENIIIETNIKVVVQDGKFFLKENAQKFNLKVHFVDDNKNILETVTYQTPVIDRVELFKDVDDDKYFISHKSGWGHNYYMQYTKTVNNYDGEQFDEALSTDKEIYFHTFEIKGIRVKLYSTSGYLTIKETIYLDETYHSFDTVVNYDGRNNPDLSDYKYWNYVGSNDLLFNVKLRDIYDSDRFNYDDEGILYINVNAVK